MPLVSNETTLALTKACQFVDSPPIAAYVSVIDSLVSVAAVIRVDWR